MGVRLLIIVILIMFDMVCGGFIMNDIYIDFYIYYSIMYYFIVFVKD